MKQLKAAGSISVGVDGRTLKGGGMSKEDEGLETRDTDDLLCALLICRLS